MREFIIHGHRDDAPRTPFHERFTHQDDAERRFLRIFADPTVLDATLSPIEDGTLIGSLGFCHV